MSDAGVHLSLQVHSNNNYINLSKISVYMYVNINYLLQINFHNNSQIANVPETHTYNTFLFVANMTRVCTESVYYKTILPHNSPEKVR